MTPRPSTHVFINVSSDFLLAQIRVHARGRTLQVNE